MTDINNNVKMICSFYASEWHLATMLLPNIDKKINKGNKITTMLEKDLQKNMETLLKKLNLENESKILNIGWTKNKLVNVDESIKNSDCIIIAGTVEYINNAHSLLKENIDENKKISIIDCYDINVCEAELKQILDEHEIVLNTSGEKEKEEYVMTIKMAK